MMLNAFSPKMCVCVHPLQEQFIELCKSLYNMFSQEAEEQQLYHSMATVASLLLRLGEVGKKFNGRKGVEPKAQGVEPKAQGAGTEAQGAEPEAQGEVPGGGGTPEEQQERSGAEDSLQSGAQGRGRGSTLDADWSITFEQVLASLLTESPLVDYFERKRDVASKMAACSAQRGAAERQNSSASSDHEPAQQAV